LLPQDCPADALPEDIRAAVEIDFIPLPNRKESPDQSDVVYGKWLQQKLISLNAYAYWNHNPLMLNVRFPIGLTGVRCIATLHDLIPYVFKTHYLDSWEPAHRRAYINRLRELESAYDRLVANSQATRNDFLAELSITPDKIVVSGCGVDPALFWPLKQGAKSSRNPYILYIGGFDPRKNMMGALEAFATFTAKLERVGPAPRMVVICAKDAVAEAGFMAKAHKLGVAHLVELTGFVTDADLARYLRSAHLFFFPSLYEGFGLPLAEAMACGVPVVTSNVASMPEVCGDLGYYADPNDPIAMAEMLYKAWGGRCKNLLPDMRLVERASRYTWERAAQVFRGVFASPGIGYPGERPTRRVAMLTPWPGQPSGVAVFAKKLASTLQEYCSLQVFAPQDPSVEKGVGTLEQFRRSGKSWDQVIYHIGNNTLHENIYAIAWDTPGTVVLHDINIHPMLWSSHLRNPSRNLYQLALTAEGQDGFDAWRKIKAGGQPDLLDLHLSTGLGRRNKCILVHSRWAARRLRERGVTVAAHHLATEEVPMNRDIGSSLNAGNGIRVGCFGYINRHKRVDSVAAACARLAQAGFPIELWLVGAVNDENCSLSKLRELAQGLTIHHHARTSDEEFESLLKAMDIVVNLRYPTMGESSATLYHALALQKATIVSDHAQFSELPASLVSKIVPDQTEIESLQSAIANYAVATKEDRHLRARHQEKFVEDYTGFDSYATTLLQLH